MARYQFKTPDGKTFEVDAPDDLSTDEAIRLARETIGPGYDRNPIEDRRRKAKALADATDRTAGSAGHKDLMAQGLTFGLSDELAGLVNAGMHPLTPDAYRIGRDAERLRLDRAREQTGWTGTATEIAGGFLTGLPAAGAAAINGLGGAVKAAARGGAMAGAAGGFGYGNEATDSLIKAGAGALLGGALGAAVPIGTRLVSSTLSGANRLMGRDTGGLARQIVGDAIAADGATPATVANRMQAASERGTPLAIADTGENVRGLLASVARRPGAARTIARETINNRQVEQSDRLVSAVESNLGRVGNMREESDALLRQARSAAAPLYDEAYAAPARTSEELGALLETPAGRQALARARTIAANERRDPSTLGFDLNEQGETILVREPSMQTVDYIKRGLDDIIEQYRDPVTQRLTLDEAGRAVNQVRGQLVAEADRLNPAYRAARAAYAGPASAEEALQLGRKALNSSAEDVEAAVSRMTPFEREQYALGFRTAMADLIGRSPDGANTVQRLIGTPRKRAALAQLFGGDEGFGRFLQTMADERATTETFQSVMRGSQTAERLAADSQTSDAGLVESASFAALRGVSEPVSLLGNALEALRNVGTFGVGRAGDEARERAAALLSETDPRILREIARSIKLATTRQRLRERRVNRITGRTGVGVGNNVGGALSAFQQPQ